MRAVTHNMYATSEKEGYDAAFALAGYVPVPHRRMMCTPWGCWMLG
jgi:hypothetical protein